MLRASIKCCLMKKAHHLMKRVKRALQKLSIFAISNLKINGDINLKIEIHLLCVLPYKLSRTYPFVIYVIAFLLTYIKVGPDY